MMKTPVKWTICPFAVGLLGMSCQGSELFQPCKTLSLQHSLKYQISISAKWEQAPVTLIPFCLQSPLRCIPFYLHFSFPCSNVLSVTQVGQNEWVRNPKPLRNLAERLKTLTFIGLHLFVSLCTLEIWPRFKGTQCERSLIWYFFRRGLHGPPKFHVLSQLSRPLEVCHH